MVALMSCYEMCALRLRVPSVLSIMRLPLRAVHTSLGDFSTWYCRASLRADSMASLPSKESAFAMFVLIPVTSMVLMCLRLGKNPQRYMIFSLVPQLFLVLSSFGQTVRYSVFNLQRTILRTHHC